MIKTVQIGSNVHNVTVLMPSSKGSIGTGKGFMVLLTFLLLQPAIGRRERCHQKKEEKVSRFTCPFDSCGCGCFYHCPTA